MKWFDLRLKFKLMEAATSPDGFLATTRYKPASVSMTSSSVNETLNESASLFGEILKNVRPSDSFNCSSPRHHSIDGWGFADNEHSKINLLPSSACCSCGFCLKYGAKLPLAAGVTTMIVQIHFSTTLINCFSFLRKLFGLNSTRYSLSVTFFNDRWINSWSHQLADSWGRFWHGGQFLSLFEIE